MCPSVPAPTTQHRTPPGPSLSRRLHAGPGPYLPFPHEWPLPSPQSRAWHGAALKDCWARERTIQSMNDGGGAESRFRPQNTPQKVCPREPPSVRGVTPCRGPVPSDGKVTGWAPLRAPLRSRSPCTSGVSRTFVCKPLCVGRSPKCSRHAVDRTKIPSVCSFQSKGGRRALRN